jgi:hypothetical protein
MEQSSADIGMGGDLAQLAEVNGVAGDCRTGHAPDRPISKQNHTRANSQAAGTDHAARVLQKP